MDFGCGVGKLGFQCCLSGAIHLEIMIAFDCRFNRLSFFECLIFYLFLFVGNFKES